MTKYGMVMSSLSPEESEKKLHDCLLQRFIQRAGLDPLSSTVSFSSRDFFFKQNLIFSSGVLKSRVTVVEVANMDLEDAPNVPLSTKL